MHQFCFIAAKKSQISILLLQLLSDDKLTVVVKYFISFEKYFSYLKMRICLQTEENGL